MKLARASEPVRTAVTRLAEAALEHVARPAGGQRLRRRVPHEQDLRRLQRGDIVAAERRALVDPGGIDRHELGAVLDRERGELRVEIRRVLRIADERGADRITAAVVRERAADAANANALAHGVRRQGRGGGAPRHQVADLRRGERTRRERRVVLRRHGARLHGDRRRARDQLHVEQHRQVPRRDVVDLIVQAHLAALFLLLDELGGLLRLGIEQVADHARGRLRVRDEVGAGRNASGPQA